MSDLLITEIPTADAMSKNIQANTLQAPLTPITALEVIEALDFRCGNGMQYTTFPNTITEEEEKKLTEKGYIVTKNTVPSEDRYGAPELYIGFQVALNNRAAQEAMQITPNGSMVASMDASISESTNKAANSVMAKIDITNSRANNIKSSVDSSKAVLDQIRASTEEIKDKIGE